jgi:integrase
LGWRGLTTDLSSPSSPFQVVFTGDTVANLAPTVRTAVPSKRHKNVRTREHLTPGEIEALLELPGATDTVTATATMILLTYRHGLRAAEVCDLRWDQVDFNGAVLPVRRVKNGTPSRATTARAIAKKSPVWRGASRSRH